MKTARIRLRVLIPLSVALALLLAAFVATVNKVQERNTTDRVANRMEAVKKLYRTRLDSDASMMAAVLRVILSNESMKEAFKAKDRDALLEWGAPLFEELRVNHRVTHFYFHCPDRVNILRLHKPEKHGDTINRFTMLEAQKTERLTHGVELGPLGTFTLRVVSPCYDNGQLLGYIELGEEIEHITQKLHEVLGVDIFVAIEKKHVDCEQWEIGMRMLGRNPNWEQFPEHVIISQTRKDLLEGLAPFLPQCVHTTETMDIDASSEGADYRCRFLHLSDASGKEVGDMIVALDVTEANAAAKRYTLFVAGICVLVGSMLFALFYFYLGRVERHLVATHRELEQWGETLEHKVQERTRELKEEIAEHKKAEEALWESKERFRAIMDNTVLGITIIDTNYKVIMANAVLANLFRKSSDDFVGKYCFREFEHREAVCPHCPGARAMASGKTEEFETHTALDDGTYVYVRNRAIPLFGSDGAIKGFIEVVENITERKQAEEALRESEQKYRTLVESIPIKVFYKDTNLAYVSCNGLYAKDLKIAAAEITGKNDYEFYPKNLAEKYRADDRRIMESGETTHIEEDYIKDGEYRTVLTVKTPVRDERGNVTGVLGIFTDITERKQAEKKLEDLYRYLKLQIDRMPIGLIVWDTEFRAKTWNPSAEEIFGFSAKEALGKHPYDLIVPREVQPIVDDIWRRLLEGDITAHSTNENITKDGRAIICQWSNTPLRKEDGAVEGVLSMVQDITERKKAEEEKEKLQEQLLQSSKMAAVGQLAGGVAHEINNPLSVILGFAQGVAKRINAGDPLEMPLKSIEREATRCKKIVQDLLVFSRTQKKEPEFIDAITTIESALSLVQSRAKTAAVEIVREFAENVPQLFANPTQVQQVIINLANNAMDAMKNGGTLTISVSSINENSKRWAEINVKDNGTGIPEEVRSHIFEPFFTTKEVGRGTGLGLGLCYEIVKNAEGTITFTTETGKGSCFTVRLPASDEIHGSERK